MKIYLIRHGESEANSKGISQGNWNKWRNTSLSKKGKGQARQIALRLECEKIGKIYSSDLKRARETAGEINKFQGVGIITDSRLRDKMNNEALEGFISKCKSFFNEIEEKGKNIAIVAHGSSCLTLLAITTGNRKKVGKLVEEYQSKYKNSCLSLIEKKGKNYKIKFIGCDNHLIK
jgi:broad specificity phosphatase PhoE